LTRRANHRHVDGIARSEARAGEPVAGFFYGHDGHARTFVPPHFSNSLGSKEFAMKNFWIGALLVGSLISFEAKAQERAGDAALGAVSGAVVLGPVGAVAGAIVGFTAGPSIARSWGMRRSASRPRVQRTSQTNALSEPQTTGQASSPPPARSPEPPRGTKPPPVQGFE
jgi:hypothetical protein